MTKYHRSPLVQEAYGGQLDPEERQAFDVLRLFGEAQRLKSRDNYSGRVARKLTLEELDDPRQREE